MSEDTVTIHGKEFKVRTQISRTFVVEDLPECFELHRNQYGVWEATFYQSSAVGNTPSEAWDSLQAQISHDILALQKGAGVSL